MQRYLPIDNAFSSRRGAFLLSVLGIILVLSLLATAFLERINDDLRYHSQYQIQPDMQKVGYSALEIALGVLHEFYQIDKGLFSPKQGWEKPLEYAGISLPEDYKISVVARDESGRFSLSKISEDEKTLNAFLEESGSRVADSKRFIDALRRWNSDKVVTRKDTGASATLYPSRRMRRFRELFFIKEGDIFFDKEKHTAKPFYKEFCNAYSLYSEGPVNINTASDIVRRMVGRLSYVSTKDVETYIAGPDGVMGTEDDRYYKEIKDVPLLPGDHSLSGEKPYDIKCNTIRIEVEVRKGDVSYLLTAVVQLTAEGMATDKAAGKEGVKLNSSGQGYPFKFLALTEDRLF